ncbi:MAG TPA: choice-of-anchor D domain-containing protein [Verrucomicrobiales bacterium]|nr:choice-of-anchor D domain-containing protein [Verrucomicrobiales bacterium]
MKFPSRFRRFFRCAVLCVLTASATARPGDLDIFFNPTGEGVMPGMVISAPSNPPNQLYKIVPLPDGKIIGMGHAFGNALFRWLPDGSLDPAFGDGGVARHVLEDFPYLDELAVQADGKILLTGHHTSGGVQRFLPDGSLDPSFGNGGTIMLNFSETRGQAGSLAIMSDGRILAGGHISRKPNYGAFHPRIWRMLPDGSLDPAFGDAGGVTLSEPGYITDLAVQPDGKVVITGTGPQGVGAWLGRLDADGAMDALFEGGGRTAVAMPQYVVSGSTRLVLQSDRRIFVAGEISVVEETAFFVNRFNHDGSRDFSFNGSGHVTTNVSSDIDFLQALSLQADGKVLLAGMLDIFSGSPEAVIVRYLIDGSLDTGFGKGGIAKFPMPGDGGIIETMTVLPEGKILLGGFAFKRPQPANILLMRVSGISLTESLSGEWPAGKPLKSGGTVELGTVLRGDPAGRETTFTLRNTGPAPLTNLSAVIGGPGASRFTLLSALPSVLNSGESMTLKAGFHSGFEVSRFAATLTIKTGDPGIEDFLIVLRGETQSPVATLTVLDGGITIAANATVDFGPALATHPVTRTFTVKNTGNIDLLIQGFTLGTAGTPRDFTLSAPEPCLLASGASTIFPVTFIPGGAGARTARLRIASTDTLNFPYEILLAGRRAVGIDAWWLTHFGTLRREGDAADQSDPDHDGVVNLVEYATLTEPDVPNPSPGELTADIDMMSYTFTQSVEALDYVHFSVDWSDSMLGPWNSTDPLVHGVKSDDGSRQSVTLTFYAGGLHRLFLRLKVTRK